jgi:hypothetical protein
VCFCLSLRAGFISEFDYCFNSEITPSRGIWISLFNTEEAHGVMLAYPAWRVKLQMMAGRPFEKSHDPL